MLIGIDANEANSDNRVGVNQYSYEILWAIYQLKSEWKNKHSIVLYLKSKPQKHLPKETSFWKYKVLTGSSVWIIFKLMPYLFGNKRPDVFFTPSHYLPPLTLMPKICTIHDLGYLKFSAQFKKYDFWQLKYWTAISLYISKYIISVSESTKNDIVRHYPFASNKIVVTYHGYDRKRYNTNISPFNVRRVKRKYHLPDNYILFLSTLKPSKNIENLLEAYKILKNNKNGIRNKLVIAGKKGWLFSTIFEYVNKLKLKKDVLFTDFVAEKDKPAMMAGAKVFVSPSFWEGFGMHVLEAMACGTPVVVSDVASLPEVVGEAGIYVDPNDCENIALGIKKVLKMSETEYNMMVERTLKQAKKFSWEKAARKIIKTLEKAKIREK